MVADPAKPPQIGRILAGTLAIALLLAACAGRQLDHDEWEDAWRETVERVDSVEADEIPRQKCQETLSFLRVQRDLLGSVPNENLRVPVSTWFDVAEAAFFGCPPLGPGNGGWDAAYDELDVLEDEIEAVLAAEG